VADAYIESGDIFTLNWSRKSALLMLAVVALWAAMPATACLLTAQPAGQPDCCRAMAQDCPMAGMSMDAPCCQFHGKNIAVVPISPFSSQRVQRLIFVPQQTGQEPSAAPCAGWRNALEAPPPKFSPGAVSILRI
jgi:hypothetical protein